ncbi:MAG TPA: SDR family oxidoreductase [Pyrinomonadaceae bacterium]|nr:SDR family oxidoreductase [Pyrinomonadaceae bacterium]
MSFTRTFFITGFPGFIAERLVERLAREEFQFFLLVESRFVEAAIESIGLLAEDKNIPLENFAVIDGDITKSDLGMDADDAATVRYETTDVFHLAAIYDLAVERDLATRVNLEGTKNVNEFVKSLRHLKRYNYVSTCYVAGKRTGEVREGELEHDKGFRNFYEETKYLAEMEVESLKSELPVTIFRPSVVVGDSESGETVKYDGIYYLILYLRKAPYLLRAINVGNKQVKLNLVPVDFVVDAIAKLAMDEKAKGKTIAIADPEPLTTAELFDTIAYEMTGRRSEFAPPPKLVEWFLSKPFSPPITGLPTSGVPYFFIDQTYDTSIANELLSPHGLKCPNFRDYIGNLLKFVDENPQL